MAAIRKETDSLGDSIWRIRLAKVSKRCKANLSEDRQGQLTSLQL
jgi:hypothetical protein